VERPYQNSGLAAAKGIRRWPALSFGVKVEQSETLKNGKGNSSQGAGYCLPFSRVSLKLLLRI